jgi:fructose-specific phosphotransferase system component IIB
MPTTATEPNASERDATAANLIISAADIRLDERSLRASESAYRRGVHHGLALAGSLVDDSLSLKQAQRMLTRAENMAGEYRSLARHPGSPPILDELRRRVLRLRKTPRARV